MTNHLKQTGTEDSKAILSIDDSAKGLYDECKKTSKLVVDYYHVNDRDKKIIFGSDIWCKEMRQYSDEFSELFRKLIEPFVLEQRLSILDITHPLKEENPVAVVCKTLSVDGLKVKDTMAVLHEGIYIAETMQQETNLMVIGDLRKIETMPLEEKTDLKVKDVVDMIYKKSNPGLYSLIMKNMQLQRLEELFYGYTPNLICDLDENVIKIWGYLEITPHAMADRIGLIVVEDVAKLIEKGAEQFNCSLEHGGVMVVPVTKMKDTMGYFTKIYTNKNLIEWRRLETLRNEIKDEKDETVRCFLFKYYKGEISKIAREFKK